MKHLITAVLLAVSAAGLSACGGAVFRPVQFAFEDRSSDRQIEDNQIDLAILDRLRKVDASLLLDTDVDVWEGRVMLTGTVDSKTKKVKIEQIAQQDGRIISLYNALQVTSIADVEARSTARKAADKAGQSLSDFWVEQKIGAHLLGTKDVAAVNYRWRCVYGQVYVIGRASTSQEKQRVLEVIRTTTGVERVTEYIWVK
ncbi:MAG: BON domain-containing protein [Proteobacteria bacterium]|nr:BON domain-containing protein [Pseudomonadota bacterium]